MFAFLTYLLLIFFENNSAAITNFSLGYVNIHLGQLTYKINVFYNKFKDFNKFNNFKKFNYF